MADYWKSQPRKFCQYCKCWIADNKPSVEFHERGKNHKENVAAKIQEIKKKSVAKAKQEQKMSKDFAAMEEAALKAYEEDLKRLADQPSGESLTPAKAPAKPQSEAPTKKGKKPKKLLLTVPSQTSSNRPDAWVGGTTDDGLVYYYNTVTGESQWDKPDGFVDQSLPFAVGQTQQDPSGSAWMEAVSPDGYTYYYNTETGESSWEKPDDFGGDDDICPPGVGSPPDMTGAPDHSSPPPPESDDTSVSPRDTAEADEAKQTSVPKISFRKRKEESQTSADEGEKISDDGGSGEEKQEDAGAADAVTPAVTPAMTPTMTPAKRARKSNPYGAWEKIQPEEDPYEKVDLQLPQTEALVVSGPQTPIDAPPEPKSRFKERTITSLGDESSAGAAFRKRKTENGKSRSLRQRGKDE